MTSETCRDQDSGTWGQCHTAQPRLCLADTCPGSPPRRLFCPPVCLPPNVSTFRGWGPASGMRDPFHPGLSREQWAVLGQGHRALAVPICLGSWQWLLWALGLPACSPCCGHLPTWASVAPWPSGESLALSPSHLPAPSSSSLTFTCPQPNLSGKNVQTSQEAGTGRPLQPLPSFPAVLPL